ncbi:hypothetical protein [Chenggangzhangella methanolivorans]|uniref:Uncharacterized protein n=1 Tax=Chenggangzhangella methanolivorans TaxID=1437009 RepID=A0A9E6RBR9_9HYPH|nr:hypothetical protein [Chenggangzhangella methanolivorans]QZO01883.1 hypothetical protein K6K41_11385 [Chenggangzhangella methanolivorans]
MRRTTFLAAAALAAVLGQPAFAQAPTAPQAADDDNRPMDCTIAAAYFCKEGGCSKTESFGDLKLPGRLLVNFESRVIASVTADGLPHITPIGTYAVVGDAQIIQGVEGGTGWMVHVNKADGDLNFTVTSDDNTLIGDGTCKKLD